MYFLQQHKKFSTISLIALLLIIFLAGIHNYFVVQGISVSIRIALKVLPIFSLFLLNFSYFVIYRLTIYAILMMGVLIFCLLADILIALYDPSIVDTYNSKWVYFIIGGSLFLIARFVLTILFAIKPYKNFSFIKHNKSKLFLSHILCVLIFTAIGALPLLFECTNFNLLIFLYVLLGFGLPFSYIILRIISIQELTSLQARNILQDEHLMSHAEPHESYFSTFSALMGLFLFNISDYLLLFTLSNEWFPRYVILISDDLYWLSIFFLVFSVVRSPHFHVEKGYKYLPVSFVQEVT